MDKENQNGRKGKSKDTATIKENPRKFAKVISGFRKESGNSGEGTDSQVVVGTEDPLSPPIDSDVTSPSQPVLGPVTPSISNKERQAQELADAQIVGDDLPAPQQEQITDAEVDAKHSEEVEASNEPLNAVQIVNEKSILDAGVGTPNLDDLKQVSLNPRPNSIASRNDHEPETDPADSSFADPEIITVTKMDFHPMSSTVISQKETEANQGTHYSISFTLTEDFTWTCGGDSTIAHVKIIARGPGSEVHMVHALQSKAL